MVNFTVSIILSGLIAIVPNNSGFASWLTAYLVKDASGNHDPVLHVYGNVSLTSDDGAPPCTKSPSCEGGYEVDCKLTDTTISLGGADEESSSNALPSQPSGKPASENARTNEDWIVRMKYIGDGAGSVKQDISSYVTSSIRFGWSTMESAELDGTEAGKDNVVLIGFKPKNGSGQPSALQQSVAEEIRFQTLIKAAPVVISVTGNTSKKTAAIHVGCSTVNCFTMWIDNSSKACDPSKEGEHFDAYYDLVSTPGSRMRPFSLESRGGCLPADDTKIDLQSLRARLTLLGPVIPRISQGLGSEFDKLAGGTNKDLRDAIEKLPNDITKDEKVCAEKLIPLEVLNRMICPPVMLEP